MKKFPDKGILAALVVPFDDKGTLKRESLKRHLEWLTDSGIHGLFVNGSTSQFPLLTPGERELTMETVAELAGSLPVIANISDMDPRVVYRLGRTAASIGLSGIGIMPPGFYPSKDADQLAWFQRAAEAVGLPVLLYNYPERTGNRVGPGTIREFARNFPMAGIKQSGGEFDYHHELIQLGRELGFSVYSGSDTRLPEIFRMGGSGCIGGMVNFAADLMVEQFRICVTGEPGDLGPTVCRMAKAGEVISREAFPANMAAGMRARGFDPGAAHLVLSRETQQNLRAMEDELRRKFQDWEMAIPNGENPS